METNEVNSVPYENVANKFHSTIQSLSIPSTAPPFFAARGTLEPIPELDEAQPQPPNPSSMEFRAEDGTGPPIVDLDTQNDMDIETSETTGEIASPITKETNAQTGMPPSPSSESTLSSLPSLETPPTSPEPSEAHIEPSSDSAWKPHEGWTADEWPTDAWDAWGILAPDEEPREPNQHPSIYEEEPWYTDERPLRSFSQQTSADEMRRTLSHLTAHLLPLTTVQFGSHMSY